MRGWLLAIIGILLVGDGYWASRNLVLKSADNGIYWFRFPFAGGQIQIEAPTGKVDVKPNKQPPLEWEGGQWVSGSAPIWDIRNFILYWNIPEDSCTIHYHLEPNASVADAMTTLDLSFAAGAGSAAILSPAIARSGKVEIALFFEPKQRDENTCPFKEAWQEYLPKRQLGVGYPPNVKGARHDD